MEYFRKVFIFVFILFATVSCTSPTENRTSNVEVTIEAGQLIIKNNTDQTVYIFAVERNILAVINWAPHFNNPSIARKNSIAISLSEIINGKSETVKEGDTIIVHWWTNQYTQDKKMNTVSITL